MCSIFCYFSFSSNCFEQDDIHQSNFSFLFIIVCDCFDTYVIFAIGDGFPEGVLPSQHIYIFTFLINFGLCWWLSWSLRNCFSILINTGMTIPWRVQYQSNAIPVKDKENCFRRRALFFTIIKARTFNLLRYFKGSFTLCTLRTWE